MSWVLDAMIHVLKALSLAVWGALRALLSCARTSTRRPDLSADVCLVTGAGQGLGRQLALQLADCGASLVLWDIDGEKVRLRNDYLCGRQGSITFCCPIQWNLANANL